MAASRNPDASSKNVKNQSTCLVCGKSIAAFISFGPMPIANGFLTAAEFAGEPFFDLAVGFCPACAMVQLTERVDPGKLFHENYAYFSSISTRMSRHFEEFAAAVKKEYLLEPDPFVVEIGSNDGIMLGHFAKAGLRHLGVEPSANVAAAARAKGIETVSVFFNEDTARDFRKKHGPADAILGANVICHIASINSLARGVRELLKDKGVFIFEEPYWGDIVERLSYDQIYDEHIFYFSVTSLTNLFAVHDLEIIDVSHQEVHGGSMRYVVARRGARPVKPSVSKQREWEQAMRLGDPATGEAFERKIRQSRDHLKGLLQDLKKEGKRVAAYGATSKSTTVTNFCGIGPDLVEFISDTTPGKQGKFSPGTHIPVVPYERFQSSPPDVALLFAWNHGNEILEKEKTFRAKGGRFAVYVPAVKILGPDERMM